MPGKVNPVVPEAVSMVGYLLMGNNLTISLGVQAGQLELNTIFPLVSTKIIESLELATRGCRLFSDGCVVDLVIDERRCQELLNASTALATKVAKYIGYDKAGQLAIEAVNSNRSFLDLVKESNLLTDQQMKELST